MRELASIGPGTAEDADRQSRPGPAARQPVDSPWYRTSSRYWLGIRSPPPRMLFAAWLMSGSASSLMRWSISAAGTDGQTE
jgi:hypothetical protein